MRRARSAKSELLGSPQAHGAGASETFRAVSEGGLLGSSYPASRHGSGPAQKVRKRRASSPGHRYSSSSLATPRQGLPKCQPVECPPRGAAEVGSGYVNYKCQAIGRFAVRVMSPGDVRRARAIGQRITDARRARNRDKELRLPQAGRSHDRGIRPRGAARDREWPARADEEQEAGIGGCVRQGAIGAGT